LAALLQSQLALHPLHHLQLLCMLPLCCRISACAWRASSLLCDVYCASHRATEAEPDNGYWVGKACRTRHGGKGDIGVHIPGEQVFTRPLEEVATWVVDDNDLGGESGEGGKGGQSGDKVEEGEEGEEEWDDVANHEPVDGVGAQPQEEEED
jgi:hypothetical protein